MQKAPQFPFLEESFYQYEEFPAPRELGDLIACVWTVKPTGQFENACELSRRILPDGCIDLVVTLGKTGIYRIQDENITSGESANFLGIQTAPIHLMPSVDSRSWWAIRFRPHAIPVFFGALSSDLVDRMEEGRSLSASFMKAFELQIRAGTHRETALRIFSMLEKQRKIFGREARTVSAVVQRIVATQGRIGIVGLCEELGLSRQYLARVFRKYTGVTPKQYGRIIRFNSVIRSLEQGNFRNWSDTAFDHGFYDQSHLISDIHEFTGFAPEALRSSSFSSFHFSKTAPLRS